jgi:F-type H+-transporting ATPase subunit b
MLIDWFTVGAQALNFLILVWLLKRFLYKPILNAIDAREKGIAAKLSDADAKTKAARKEHDEFDRKNLEFDQQRSALLSKATSDAKTEHDRLIDEARKEAQTLRATQAAALKNDHDRLRSEITRAATDEVFSITRKTLADLSTASLEERIGAVFTRRLGEMDAKSKELMRGAIKTSAEPAILESAFEMPDTQRATIQNALNETFAAEVRVQFKTAKEPICGIELTANGQKMGWNIAEYLTALNRKVAELITSQPEPAAK